jgi:hypothetical protein
MTHKPALASDSRDLSPASATSATTPERRRKRSADPLVALHYQLAHARKDGALDVLVLADTAGMVVAGAGSWVVCEELAAYAPLLAQEPEAVGLSHASRVASLRADVDVLTMSVHGQPLFLCSMRGGGVGGARSGHDGGGTDGRAPRQATGYVDGASAKLNAARGVTRILETTL